jgi:molybdenum cofactor biosynthesis enzyme MoaA
MYTHDSVSGITTFSQEVLDLREIFVLLTYQCNGNCPFCIEHSIGKKGFLSYENFDKALDFATEKGLTSVFLHGGEPTIHPSIVDFAQKAKDKC